MPDASTPDGKGARRQRLEVAAAPLAGETADGRAPPAAACPPCPQRGKMNAANGSPSHFAMLWLSFCRPPMLRRSHAALFCCPRSRRRTPPPAPYARCRKMRKMRPYARAKKIQKMHSFVGVRKVRKLPQPHPACPPISTGSTSGAHRQRLALSDLEKISGENVPCLNIFRGGKHREKLRTVEEPKAFSK